eukprot:225169-Heterocapsa_arctica.AAC.1
MTIDEFKASMKGRRHTAPGPDGAPILVYSLCDGIGAAKIYEVYTCTLAGRPRPSDFLESLRVFIPKDSLPNDPIAVVRSPSSLRPLNWYNNDSKLITE